MSGPRSDPIFANMSARGWWKLVAIVAGGILSCCAISLAFNYILFLGDPASVRFKGAFSATALPVALAGPLFFYLSLKLRQLSYLNRQLKHLADHDHLTALLNRGAFLEAFAEPQPEAGHCSSALLLVDVDRFKVINDRWGHATGDEVLRKVAAAIRSELRTSDIVGRFGGEEFGICLRDADLHDATLVAMRIRTAVEALRIPSPDSGEIRVTISIGLVTWRGERCFEKLYHCADRKLYEAKANGRNRIEMLESEHEPGLTPAWDEPPRAHDQRLSPLLASSAR